MPSASDGDEMNGGDPAEWPSHEDETSSSVSNFERGTPHTGLRPTLSNCGLRPTTSDIEICDVDESEENVSPASTVHPHDQEAPDMSDRDNVSPSEPVLVGALIEASQISIDELLPHEEVQLMADVDETFEDYARRVKKKANKALKRKWSNLRKTANEKLDEAKKRREQRRLARLAETVEERNKRNDEQRAMTQMNREKESEYQSNSRLSRDRVSRANARDNEDDFETDLRLEDQRARQADLRNNEDEEQRTQRLQDMRDAYHRQRVNPRYTDRAANSDNVDMFRLGGMDVECTFCHALHFAAEPRAADGTFNSCCNKGRVNVRIEPEFPEELKSLLKREEGTDWKEFHSNIIRYNTSLSFAYTTGQVRQLPGIFHYRVYGQVMHYFPRYTDPMAGQNPAYGQLWVIETDDAIEYRCQAPFASTCDRDMFELLHNIISRVNKYAEIYRMLYEIEDEERAVAEAEGRAPHICKIVFKKVTDNTSDQYALPRGNEVAAVYICDENGDIPVSDIVVQRRCEPNETPMCERYSKHDEHIEPLTFVIFNPLGVGDYWHYGKPKRSDNPNPREEKMTALQYFLFKLSLRPENDNEPFNPLLHGGKLLSKYLVWSYALVENGRMAYLRSHQKELRVDSYAGLTDFLKRFSDENGVQPGKRVVLPSSYDMGPRSQAEFLNDAMAMTRLHGKPHLFITMTCNPAASDISENLFENQKAYDRPDLVDTVFQYQVKQFVKEMKENAIFGKVKAYLYVVEFQKRGLPHIHSLWFFEDPWTDASKIDSFICAELPEESEDKELFDLVVTHMIHRPCGANDPNARCMQDGRCKRHFPKNFCDETTLDENSFPSYRRRDDGRQAVINFKRQPFTIDNRSVVPYNGYLLKRFRCHINVEVVSSLRTVNYLFKYLFKGNDRAAIEITNGVANLDEIKAYLDTRYLSAHEAYWKLKMYKMHMLSDSVERLQVHLPQQQMVTMAVDADEEAMIRASLRKSKLLAFFKLNEDHPNGRNRDLTYYQCCFEFTWKAKQCEWHPRGASSKAKCPRMYSVNPKQTELFYLRKLLSIVKGPRNYEDLRRDQHDESIVYATFREACVARGLVESDQMYYDALDEGSYYNMPKQLRCLFARIVAHCDVEAPLWLWNQFRFKLIHDLLRSHGGDIDLAEQLAWRITLRMIMYNDRSLDDYPILKEIAEIVGIEDEDLDVTAHRIQGDNMRTTLNEKQGEFYEAIMSKVLSPDGTASCFFLDGPGGSGKSYVFNCLFSTLIGMSKRVIVMAWSGIAASIYETGRTVHNVFKLDFPFNDDSNSGVAPSDALGKDLKAVDVIIWDEAPMAPRRALEVIDEKLREIMSNEIPFGGKVIILGGDFRQLGPVVNKGTRNDVVRTSVKMSKLWEHFEKSYFTLTENKRADANSNDGFAEDILAIGDGSANDSNETVQLPEDCIVQSDLVELVFRDLIEAGDYSSFTSRAILSTVNADVDDYNERIINLLDESTEKTYTAIDRVESIGEDSLGYNPEHFESFRPAGFPAYELRLRVKGPQSLSENDFTVLSA